MEFDKYEEYGPYHWNHFHHDTTYRAHALKVRAWVTEKNVLDIGAGDGLIAHLLKCRGIDTNETAIRLARQHGVKVTYGSVYDVSGQYDAVFFGDVLEHLDRPKDALRQIAEVTDTLYIATPPRPPDGARPYHVQEWTPEELESLLTSTGWRVLTCEVENERIYVKCKR